MVVFVDVFSGWIYNNYCISISALIETMHLPEPQMSHLCFTIKAIIWVEGGL